MKGGKNKKKIKLKNKKLNKIEFPRRHCLTVSLLIFSLLRTLVEKRITISHAI